MNNKVVYGKINAVPLSGLILDDFTLFKFGGVYPPDIQIRLLLAKHYQLLIVHKGVSAYRIAKDLQSKGHKISRQAINAWFRGKYLLSFQAIALLYNHIGLRFPEDVLAPLFYEENLK